MKKFISLLLALMLIASVAVVSAAAAGTATVTVVALDGKTTTKTYNVGDEFTVYTVMNLKDINDGKIASIMGQQTYNSSVLQLVADVDSEGLVTDLETMFPVSYFSSTIANANEKDVLLFSSSTPKKPYVFDSDTSKLIVTTYKVKAAGEAEVKTTLTTLAMSDFNLTKIITKGNYTEPSYASKVTVKSTFTDPELPVTGVKVSGKITSYLKAADEVTVTLTGVDNEFVGDAKGTDEYAVENVPAGTYKLEVSKKDHVTREYEITVADADVAQDVVICPRGDISGDGKTTQFDAGLAILSAKRQTKLDAYQIKCGDVFGEGDGKVTMADAARITMHVKRAEKLY